MTASDGVTTTRDRLITEAMRLFGRKGYAATSVSEIEAAAGLSAGSGSLYRHFSSKEELLSAGVREQIAAGRELVELVRRAEPSPEMSLRSQLAAIAVAGLQRLEGERDLNRILLRDIAVFPALLELARTEEIGRIHLVLAAWLREHAAPERRSADWTATATVMIGAISHYWLLRDIFGSHPAGVDDARYIDALVDMALPGLGGRNDRERNG